MLYSFRASGFSADRISQGIGIHLTSASFNSEGPMSHCDATSVTHAFRRDENAGKGLENITAKLRGNHGGNSDLSTLLYSTPSVEWLFVLVSLEE